ncbi:MAG: hypothetical protein IPN34_15500 [Planctomycetes bacterium]|nr:hypothetical protein [Planctomycetota bacterium]
MRFGNLTLASLLALGAGLSHAPLGAQCVYGGGGGGGVVSGGGSNNGGNSNSGASNRGGSNRAGGGGSSVSTPASTPAGPSTGAPDSGPATGAPTPGGPAVPATGPSTPGVSTRGRGGMALDLRRHEHSQKLLALEWDYASVMDVEKSNANAPTSSEGRMQALSREAALAKLTAKDKRPLLVLRECEGCAGSEVALFQRKIDNERTQVLAQFFHCVKFRPNVLAPSHPFRQLFDAEKPAHLMLVSADGTTVIPFDGAQSQSELWKGMLAMLKQECERPAESAAMQLSNLMNEYDVLDLERKHLREALERELEKDGADSHRSGTLAKKVERVEAKLKELEAREARLLDIGLKTKAEATTKL